MKSFNSVSYIGTLNLYSKIKRNQKKPKERKKYHTRMIMVFLAIVIAILFLASCTSVNSKYQFKNSNDAINYYRAFLKCQQNKQTETTDELIADMNEWSTLCDTVYNYISEDPSFLSHAHLPSCFIAIHDSIKTEMIRLAVIKDRTFEDVFRIKMSLVNHRKAKDMQEYLHAARQFYESLDCISSLHTDKNKTLAHYRDFLAGKSGRGLKSTEDLTEVLQAEDILFRTFLSHISEYADESLTDIASGTERLCKDIFGNVADSTLNASEVMAYMSMRINRRLIMNADSCLASIHRGDRLNERQQEAYYWMLIQPYITIDGTGMSLLTSDQEENLLNNAKEIRRVLQSRQLDIKVNRESELCSLILKLYISAN